MRFFSKASFLTTKPGFGVKTHCVNATLGGESATDTEFRKSD